VKSSKLGTQSGYFLKWFIMAAAVLGIVRIHAGTLYWDTTSGAGNGVGGSGTWGATFSTSSTGDATLTTAATTDDAVFQGTPGIVTLDANQTVNSLAFNVTGYSLTSSGASTRILTGNISLADNVSLTLASTPTGGLTISSISGSANSALNIGGTVSTSNEAVRINLNSGAVIASSVPITIATAGSNGIAGFVSGSATATINANITNNTSVLTMLGATSGNTLVVGGTLQGSAGVQFSTGAAGGTGAVTLNAANTYAGITRLNGGSTGVVKLGVDNALPIGTAVIMGYSAGTGQTLDLNGHDQMIASLSSNIGGTGLITNSASGTGTNTLTINGSTATSFGLGIADGSTRKTALVISGGGSLTLTNSNTFSGPTTIMSGTLNASAMGPNQALGGTGKVIAGSGGILVLGSNDQINNTASMVLSGGTLNVNTHTEGSSAAVGMGALTLTQDSALDFAGISGGLLHFSSSNQANGQIPQNWSGRLNIYDWANDGTDQLYLGTSNTGLNNTQLSQIYFYSDAGSGFLGNGQISAEGGVTPVPEPSTILAGLVVLGFTGVCEWRRRAVGV
jgi:fibronectin-binding autotransporter adhesin